MSHSWAGSRLKYEIIFVYNVKLICFDVILYLSFVLGLQTVY